eukprot:9495332-Pyramimonas_sp.AAC.1
MQIWRGCVVDSPERRSSCPGRVAPGRARAVAFRVCRVPLRNSSELFPRDNTAGAWPLFFTAPRVLTCFMRFNVFLGPQSVRE